jgi:hypothetical protein
MTSRPSVAEPARLETLRLVTSSSRSGDPFIASIEKAEFAAEFVPATELFCKSIDGNGKF